MVKEIATAQEFKDIIAGDKLVCILTVNSLEQVVVDFYATWCGPCKFISPKIEEFSKKYTDVVFIKVDVDNLNEVSAECSVRAMPTFQMYKLGEKVGEVVGADASKLEAKIKELIAA